jgi:ligand-binding SRPBCC domain-containing protein
MKIYTLHRTMTVPVPQREAFAFFEDPRNLARITPSWLNFRIASPEPVEMRINAKIAYHIRWLGLSLSWKTIITQYDPPRCFVDEQTRGPYSFWRHQHILEPVPGGTRIVDHLDYALPFGFLGRLAHATIVQQQIETIFDYRAKAIRAYFGESI